MTDQATNEAIEILEDLKLERGITPTQKDAAEPCGRETARAVSTPERSAPERK